MKSKKGFTLAEVIIAVGVIGVMAALMATTLHQAKPDQTRFMYLKAYDGLKEAVILMGENEDLFNKEFTIEDVLYKSKQFPFLDTTAPRDIDYDNEEYCGKLKFAKLLMVALKGEDEETSNDDNSYTFKSGPGNYTWKVTPHGSLGPDPNVEGLFNGIAQEIQLTIGNNNKDQFRFCVQPDGNIEILKDTLSDGTQGDAYISTRHSVGGASSGSDNLNSECESIKLLLDNNNNIDYE